MLVQDGGRSVLQTRPDWLWSTPSPLVSYPEEKRPRRKADNSPPSNAEVKNEWSIPLLPLYAFMVWAGTTLRCGNRCTTAVRKQ